MSELILLSAVVVTILFKICQLKTLHLEKWVIHLEFGIEEKKRRIKLTSPPKRIRK